MGLIGAAPQAFELRACQSRTPKEHLKELIVNPGNVTVAASLVKYLRRGVKRQLGVKLLILAVQVNTVFDRDTYYEALADLYDAQALFETVGVTDEPERLEDLELDLGRWPQLIPSILESQYELERARLRHAAAEGFDLPPGDIPALERLVMDVRKKVGAPSQARGRRSAFFGKRLSRRRTRRHGDG